MDTKLLKMAVGLALESAIVYRIDADELGPLYDDPDPGPLRGLHDRLIASEDYREREAAIWLETSFERGSPGSDPGGLAREMREMEFVLYSVINRAGEAQREVNQWMNYVANAAQFIEDGYWIDAKILLSRALYVSRMEAVEGLKSDPNLGYEISVLQKATASYFEEMRDYPLGLHIPEALLERALSLQENLLGLMDKYYRGERQGVDDRARKVIHRLSFALRYLIEGKEPDAEREMGLALNYLGSLLGAISDDAERGEMDGYRRRLEELTSVPKNGG